MFTFDILSRQKGSKARAGSFKTPHGDLLTPELAIVATEGEVKAIPKKTLKDLPFNLIIVNTFHLWTKGILSTVCHWISHSANASFEMTTYNNETIQQFNNIHDCSGFPRVIMSDSGGFQVFSLGFGKTHGVGKVANIFPGEQQAKSDLNNPLNITDQGVQFCYNDQDLVLTPEKSIKLQHQIGADIIFAFDECTSPLNSKEYTAKALDRTHEWLKRCIKTHKQLKSVRVGRSRSESVKSGKKPIQLIKPATTDLTDQALFGIIQGGEYQDLRIKSAQFVGKQDVPGFGIGGSLGKSKTDMFNVLEWTLPHLPDTKPRHLLGIGQVGDIFEAVERGIDLFDCVIPTREARHKVLYTFQGKKNVRKLKNIDEVFDKKCQCYTCLSGITYKKLYQLYLQKDPQAFFYATIHNLFFYSSLTKKIREAIDVGKFIELKNDVLKFY